jgi:hypothetical protein
MRAPPSEKNESRSSSSPSRAPATSRSTTGGSGRVRRWLWTRTGRSRPDGATRDPGGKPRQRTAQDQVGLGPRGWAWPGRRQQPSDHHAPPDLVRDPQRRPLTDFFTECYSSTRGPQEHSRTESTRSWACGVLVIGRLGVRVPSPAPGQRHFRPFFACPPRLTIGSTHRQPEVRSSGDLQTLRRLGESMSTPASTRSPAAASHQPTGPGQPQED